MDIGKDIILACCKNPAKLEELRKIASALIDSQWKMDDRTCSQRRYTEYLITLVMWKGAMKLKQKIGDQSMIAFYSPLLIGEYTMKENRA